MRGLGFKRNGKKAMETDEQKKFKEMLDAKRTNREYKKMVSGFTKSNGKSPLSNWLFPLQVDFTPGSI